MSEKSGIQMLEEIIGKLTLIDRRCANLEFIIKELLSRTNTSGIKIQPANEPINEPIKTNIVPATIKTAAPVAPAQPTKIGDAPINVPTKIDGKVKVLGQIKNKEGRYVSGVNVKLFDTNNQVIKETRTNKAGEWMSLLPPGKYRADYFLENIINSSVNFNALPGQTMIRVAQPNYKEG